MSALLMPIGRMSQRNCNKNDAAPAADYVCLTYLTATRNMPGFNRSQMHGWGKKMSKSFRLSEKQVDNLDDTLHKFIAGASETTYHSQVTADPNRKIGIVRAVDCPSAGFTTLSTFGLAHNSWSDLGFPDRVELVYGYRSEDSLEELKFFGEVARSLAELREVPRP